MENFKYVLFDLDGTLTDPVTGITNSVMYALDKFGITVTDRTELYKFIGPPLVDSFMEFYGFTKADAEKALAYYREYFSVKGIYENEIYSGIKELLETLSESGKKIILATSKPEKYAKEILKYFAIDNFFHFIAAATMDEKRNTKDAVIEYAIKECGITDTASAVMIGDRKFDISGGKKFGLHTIGVTYGYGSFEEITTANPTFIAESVEKLNHFLVRLSLI